MSVQHHKKLARKDLSRYRPIRSFEKETQDLPVYEYKEIILEALKTHDIIIVAGETGSGKSTQIPKYIFQEYLQANGDSNKMVGITQPRRLAAITLAKRVAMEVGVRMGREVGYCVRFDDRVTPNITRIKYLTDGMLLRELLIDPMLEKYSVLCLDEVHERSLRTDILFGLLKLLQEKRRHS